MNPFYYLSFAVLAVCTAALELAKASGAAKPFASNRGFLAFRNNYLFVYTLMMGMFRSTDCLAARCGGGVCRAPV